MCVFGWTQTTPTLPPPFSITQVAFPDIGHGAGAAKRTFALLDRVPAVRAGCGGLTPAAVGGTISFEDVAFSYPSRPTAPVLTGLTLAIAPGETLAIVGESGGGKSTLLALVARFYDPAAGRITLDGVDVRDLVTWLRSAVGYANQEVRGEGWGGVGRLCVAGVVW